MAEQGNPSDNGTDSQPRLPDTLRLGSVHLTVTDLDRSVGFYEKGIGLRLHRREGGVAAMGVGGEDLLVLYGEPGARARAGAAGIATEDRGGGLLVRDPWGIAVLFVTPEALGT